jgi:hypothetical protein
MRRKPNPDLIIGWALIVVGLTTWAATASLALWLTFGEGL